MKNLLLIDSSVPDYQVFVDSVNQDTVPMVYPETREELVTLLMEYDSIPRIGIVSIKDRLFL